MNTLLRPAFRGKKNYYGIDKNDPTLVLFAPLWDSELQGSTFYSKDSSPKLLTVTGATWGYQGRKLNGTSDNINLGNNAAFDFERTSPFSAFVWAKKTSGATSEFLIGKQLTSGTYRGWMMYIRSATGLRISVSLCSTDTTNDIWGQTDALILTTTNFNFFGFTYTGSSAASGLVTYMNGLPIAFTASRNNLDATMIAAGEMRIFGQSTFLTGTGGDAFVYNRALSASEILNLYLATKGRYS